MATYGKSSGFFASLGKALGSGGSHTTANKRKGHVTATHHRGNVSKRAAAVPGTYRTDRKARGGGELQGARANVRNRAVTNQYDSRGNRTNAVQRTAAQYSGWWGNR